MAEEFRLPDIGEGLVEGEIVRWLVPVGGSVQVDEALVEVETDKAVVEIPAPSAGVVLSHGAEEGSTIQVGSILAVIGEQGEVWVEGAEAVPEAAGEPVGETRTSVRPASVQALPVVRRLARELHVDLALVEGSGPQGRITRDDVLAAAAGTGSEERVPMSRLRRTIAEHLTRSWREIPHVTTFDEVDGAPMLTARSAAAKRLGRPVPLEALIIRAVLPVLREFPEFNASLDGDDLVLHRRYDIGIAVDTPEGLIVPVVKGAETMSLEGMSAEVLRLSAAAKERSLVPDEVSGATFTVSNVGAVGGGFGTPIIPYGTTAVLSVGRAVDKPVVRAGSIDVAAMAPLSLSYDHRVIDGALGRRFMKMLMANFESPEPLL